MNILLVEDDHLQVEFLSRELQNSFSEALIRVISTESEFRLRFEEISQSPPDVIVLDVMVRWADATPDIDVPPEDVCRDGFYTAGLRCEELLARDPQTNHIPVILYTVLEPTDLHGEIEKRRDNVVILTKAPEIDPLVELIRELTRDVRAI